jgi:Zn-dependent protease with chaperone function
LRPRRGIRPPAPDPMNFFESQRQARSQSRRLLLLFALAVLAIVIAIDAVLVLALLFGESRDPETALSIADILRGNVGTLVFGAIATAALIGVASLFKMATLRSGGSAVAQSLGATLVPSDTRNPHHRRLRNVVEEIAIASGVPVPEIYVLEQEAGINAFAAGYSPADAAIAVTRGALEKLTRDELQGVIAHEFSHVLNGDMRLNIQLMGVLFGILVLGIIGRKLLENMRHVRDSKGTVPIFVIALAVMVVGYAGVFFGRIIKAGISRQREFLADASAVQFTRQTLGIAGALKKVGGLAEGSKLERTDAEEVSHMLFGDGVGYSALFATHPALAERIRRLDPQFDPRQYGEIAKRWSAPVDVLALDDELAQHGAAGLAAGAAATTAALPSRRAEVKVSPHYVATQVGNPGDDDYVTADAIHRQIPKALLDAAHDQASAMEVVFALLLDSDPAIASRQLSMIAGAAGSAAMTATEELLPKVGGLHPMARLPLAAMAFPAIRRFPRPNLVDFGALLEKLIHADGKIGLFEYCLARLVATQVTDTLDPARAAAIGRRKLVQCTEHVATLFSVVAAFGQDDDAAARRAFAAGMNRLFQQSAPAYALPDHWVDALDRALPELDALDATAKQMLIEALVVTISTDGRVAVNEAELLRVVCAALHCPLPPMLAKT